MLSQLRSGFHYRPTTFPSSVILCGMRDVRDYKAASGGGPVRMGSSSPFNVKEESIRLTRDPPRLALGSAARGRVGVGRKRIDLVVRWPYTSVDGRPATQRFAMELKVWRDRDKKGDPLVRGLTQLDEYLAKLGLDEGVLVIFDCRSGAEAIEERTRFESTRTETGRPVTVLRA